MTLLLEDRINKIFDSLYEIDYKEFKNDKKCIEIIIQDKKSKNVHQSRIVRLSDEIYLSEIKAEVIKQACGFVIRSYAKIKNEKKLALNAIKESIDNVEE